ncbi:ATP-binding protein [Rhodopseudomonas palustris]|uniref:ATP-binding protein n=1 Tax=Rhodopseudomonas palustris TaxID=1076 RepID=UPI00115D52E5|nr:ATP-binding protein [Rhodopseudomonas palustris]QDL99517.1 ATP-binding protein [Rhodopseudomonas palustris]
MPGARRSQARGGRPVALSGVPFQTRARTIDHLGRGQIADAPTAVSELWKNSYDAYARDVALHIFDGHPEIGLVTDDGGGMSIANFRERWLVIGTESKIEFGEDEKPETFGLSERVRQGEKGIGRLSAAFLAPISFVVSKTTKDKFAGVLVDWRLFENPFLLIEDIRIPTVEFDRADDILELTDGMIEIICSNFGVSKAEARRDPDSRVARLYEGWRRFSEYEEAQKLTTTTHDEIQASWTGGLAIEERHLAEWPVYSGLGKHGTALFMVGLHHDLAHWVRPGPKEDSAKEDPAELLRRTLTGFIDPYSKRPIDFNYEVLLHNEGRTSRIISSQDVFGYDELLGLEHVIDGAFDARGRFKGRVIAFGKDLGIQEYAPRRPPPASGRDHVGPFRFCIGTFEQLEKNTTHSDRQLDGLFERAKMYGGLAVYRDGLRVMPYGRPDSDFFRLEERRSQHAGRYFFSFRRVFGRVAISRNTNPYLKDKAGREGLVENRARAELRTLVIDLLIEFAARYFGSDAPLRQDHLAEIEKRAANARETTEKIRVDQRSAVRSFVKNNTKAVAAAKKRVEQLRSRVAEIVKKRDRAEVSVVTSIVRNMHRELEELRPPPPPRKLGNFEDDYRQYRDAFSEVSESVEKLRADLADAEAKFGAESPQVLVKKRAEANSAAIAEFLKEMRVKLSSRFGALQSEWTNAVHADFGRYDEAAAPLIKGKTSEIALASTLNLLDMKRSDIEGDLRNRYGALIRALDRLKEGLDLEEALSVIDDDRAELEDRLKDIYQVAQLGIAVEIIGHELETLDAEVRRNLSKLPEEVKALRAFKLAFDAHAALTDKLRFLSPLKVAGYRNREVITGAEIADYVEEFFRRRFRQEKISFTATKQFRAISFNDLRSRIYPVFINLMNNSLYWLSFVNDRRVIFDFVDGKVVIADSGKGVDPDDVGRLFQLFFTKRSKGRGLGLFLSRANLAVARHQIRYASGADPRVLDGANFIIEFQGLSK